MVIVGCQYLLMVTTLNGKSHGFPTKRLPTRSRFTSRRFTNTESLGGLGEVHPPRESTVEAPRAQCCAQQQQLQGCGSGSWSGHQG